MCKFISLFSSMLRWTGWNRGNHWAARSENVPPDKCFDRRFISACAYAQSDQNLHWALLDSQGCKVSSCETDQLCHWCAGWFESSLGAHDRRYIFSSCGLIGIQIWQAVISQHLAFSDNNFVVKIKVTNLIFYFVQTVLDCSKLLTFYCSWQMVN